MKALFPQSADVVLTQVIAAAEAGPATTPADQMVSHRRCKDLAHQIRDRMERLRHSLIPDLRHTYDQMPPIERATLMRAVTDMVEEVVTLDPAGPKWTEQAQSGAAELYALADRLETVDDEVVLHRLYREDEALLHCLHGEEMTRSHVGSTI
ncbi:hypothetical protein [Streptosporangium roseum]|uniref:hypothetical protein n=1 Tax=Streptosporangium roseum TaxID=2001 RepID=UPI0004CD8DE1|nr:hypothetical protein [Streptosporangium roseum]